MNRMYSESTGCKVEKVYISLGTDCTNLYTRFQLLHAHSYINFHAYRCMHGG